MAASLSLFSAPVSSVHSLGSDAFGSVRGNPPFPLLSLSFPLSLSVELSLIPLIVRYCDNLT